LQKIVERDYTIPQPQTSEEVISYYAKRIAQDVKLPSQFASLVPKVREFCATAPSVKPSTLQTQRSSEQSQPR
jgi:type III restriction enzyme